MNQFVTPDQIEQICSIVNSEQNGEWASHNRPRITKKPTQYVPSSKVPLIVEFCRDHGCDPEEIEGVMNWIMKNPNPTIMSLFEEFIMVAKMFADPALTHYRNKINSITRQYDIELTAHERSVVDQKTWDEKRIVHIVNMNKGIRKKWMKIIHNLKVCLGVSDHMKDIPRLEQSIIASLSRLNIAKIDRGFVTINWIELEDLNEEILVKLCREIQQRFRKNLKK